MTRECPQCHRPRNVAEFCGYKWLAHLCRKCRWAAWREQNMREEQRKIKRCAHCGEFKPWAEFGKSRGHRYNLANDCKPCALEMNRASFAKRVANRKPRLDTKARIDLIVRLDRECGGLPELVAIRLRELRKAAA